MKFSLAFKSPNIVVETRHTVYMSTFKSTGREWDGPHPRKIPKYTAPLSSSAIKKIFDSCGDFEMRETWPGLDGDSRVRVCWLDGVVDGGAVGEDVIRPLTESRRVRGADDAEELVKLLERGGIYSYSVKRRESTDDVVTDIANGFCAVIFDSESAALTFEVRTKNTRSISDPTVEKSIKGAKDAFVETLRINTSLVRRRLRTPDMKLEQTVVGRHSGTTVAVLWLDGIADSDTVAELMRRLGGIDIDGLVAAGSLEEYIVDRPGTPFPQLIHTERPDKFAMALLDGRIGVIADGIPLGFLLPVTLSSFMNVAEDNCQHFIVASAMRLLRWAALLCSLALPALLVAVAMFHQEMIPLKLLVSMVEAKQSVPFGVASEVIAMLLAFELLQEAGMRLPDPVGQTVSIIGALIVGQSAVEARVVSPIPVIIVALAGICGYTLPSQDLSAAVRLLRIPLTLAAALTGLYGVVLGLALIVWHLAGIESFGIPYTAPFSSCAGGFPRAILRRPLKSEKFRDPELGGDNLRRQR